MNKTVAVFGLSLLWAAGHLLAADRDFNVVFEKKRLDAERSQSRSTTVSKEEWGYKVTVENKSFKDQAGLTAKYILYMKDVGGGNASAIQSSGGTMEIPDLKNSAKVTLLTEGMNITRTQLKPGWYYPDGTRPRLTDSLNGIWLRIYRGEELLGEYANPPTIPTREKWEAPKEKNPGKKNKRD